MSDAPAIFGVAAVGYRASRPNYPDALFTWIADRCAATERVWDCATGNGQAAAGLAPRFGFVAATDASREQIALAAPYDNVRYCAAASECAPFAARSFDCVVVAQALHWFDYDRFWPEVRRVSRPGAFFCAFGYAWFDCDADIDRRLVAPLRALLEPYWSAQNAICWNGLRDEDVDLPFRRVAAPTFAIEVEWTIAELAAYVRSWSAFIRMRAVGAKIAEAEYLLAKAQRDFADSRRRFTMPLSVLAARID